MKKKKRKLKIKSVIVLVLIIIIILVLLSPFFFVKISLYGNKKMIVNYGDKYSEPGYKGKVFGKSITDDIVVKSNIKDELGTYKVSYTYNFLFYKIRKTRKIVVDDVSAPKIELTGGDEIELTINTIYSELGYSALDNLDGDVTDKVKITNNIDNTKLGTYEVKYEVTDSHGNKATKVRKVKVEKLRPTQMSVAEYTLDGWYEEAKLKETDMASEEYFDSITMVGDSNTMNMYLNGYLSGIRAWALPCLHSESMHNTKINLYGLDTKMLLLDAVSEYKPEILILSLGTFSTAWISEDVFLENANSIIKQIKEKSPETKLILSSIYPIKDGYNINNFTQETINRYNFLILEMADKHNVKFLDVQEVLKDERGYGKAEYFVDDNFHLSFLGHRVVKDYIKSHMIEEEI